MQCADNCERIETDLSDEQALVVLGPYFEAMVSIFEDTFPEVCAVRFEIDRDMNSTPRHFAGCYTSGDRIAVSPDMVELPEEVVMGIMAHELGHAVDFLNPAIFYLGKSGLTMRDRDELSDKAWRRYFKAWKGRDHNAVEFLADAIAEHATGQRIGYAGPCCLQHYGRGQPRPAGLR